MKTILVPIDFSKTANIARDYAINMALAFDAELIVSHAYEVPFSGGTSGAMINIDKLHRDDAKKKLLKVEQELIEKWPDLRFSTINDASLPVDSIKKIAAEKNVDLVIMGTTGASGVQDMLIGSTTSSVIGKISSPLLTLPKNSELHFPKKVIVATDFGTLEKEKVFKCLAILADKYDSTIDFVNVSTNSEEEKREFNKDKMKSIFGSNLGEFHSCSNESVEEGIIDFMQDKDYDLLTVVAHSKSFWERLWNKSMSRTLVKHVQVPVLVLPD